MWDTIEHLYDPLLAVRASAEALKPGGVLALTTGDLDALLPRIQRKSWRLIHPSHLYYLSRNSITWLLNMYGLEVVHFSHVGFYRSVRQMTQVITFGRQERNWRHTLMRFIRKLPLPNLYIPLNLIMFVVAQKKTG